MAGGVLLVVALCLAAVIPGWRGGAVRGRTVLRSTPMPLLTVAQAAPGSARVRGLHVPLGA